MIYRQPYIIVSASHSNDKAPASTCHTDQLHFSAQETKNVEEEEEGHFWARLCSKFQPFKPLLFL